MDNTSPLLFALNLPSIVDISKGSSTMTFSAQAVDFRVQGLDNLGIDYVSILLDRPVLDGRGWWQWQLIYIGNNFYAGSSTDTFTDNTPATANSTYEVSSNALPGAYNVMGVDVHDISGSVKSYL